MIETIVTALLPIVVTLLLGFFAGWERNFDQKQAAVLNRMVMLFALPLLLFAGILSTPLAEATRNVSLFVWTAVGMVGGFVLVFLVSLAFGASAKLSALRAIAIAGPAVPFVGVPVLGVLYPSDAALAIAAGSLIMNLVQVPLALIFLAGGAQDGSPRSGSAAIGSLVAAVRQPVVWAPVLAFVLLLLGLEMPKMLKGSFLLLGQSTGGVSLFAVGVVLFSEKVSLSIPVLVNVLCKNVLLPAAILAAMAAVAAPAADRGLVAVTLAIPTASVAVIFAVEYRCGEQEMASTLFFSTLLSVVTMGAFIWIAG